MQKRDFLKMLPLAGAGLLVDQSFGGLRSFRTREDRRAINWMWLRKGREHGPDQWKRLFARARDAGIHAVLPEVYNSKKALYRSDRHPQGDLWLEEILPLAREAGLEVHAWMWQMPCNQESVWSVHPEWYAVSRAGEPSWKKPAYVDYYRFLCPSRPGVREFLRANIAEVAAFDGLAGIHLDYIRYPDVILARRFQEKYGIVQDKEYPEYDYCYCDLCRTSFKEIFGKDPLLIEDPASDMEWIQFRYDRITSLVNTVLVPEIRRHGKISSAAVFPNWQAVRQQWIRWDIDALLPMLYHGFYDADIDWIYDQTAWGVRSIGGSRRLYAGLFVGHLDAGTLAQAVEASRRGGASGISLFEGRGMDEELWAALKAALRRD